MFKWLKQDPIVKLEKQHKALLKQAFELSKTNRSESDKKVYEAEQIALKIEVLKK
ncbi:Lacal_2735 family protein [Flavobacteriaceae bacterium]|nr:Lacal_2735 family protein [Flavobacteriaceae bacterium]